MGEKDEGGGEEEEEDVTEMRTERRKGERKEASLRKVEEPELIKIIQRRESAPSEKEYDDKRHYIKMNERGREKGRINKRCRSQIKEEQNT